MNSPEQAKDFDSYRAAEALLSACGNAKKIARAAGRSERTGRRWGKEADRSSPLYKVGRMVLKMANPWPVIVYLASLAIREEITDGGFLDEWTWRQAMREALDEQQGPDGMEDEVSQRFLMGRATPMDLFNAFSAFLSAAFRVTALALYGAAKGYSMEEGR